MEKLQKASTTKSLDTQEKQAEVEEACTEETGLGKMALKYS